MYLKNKDTLGFVCDVVLWYMMLIGLVLILLPIELFGSIAPRYRLYSRPPSPCWQNGWQSSGVVGILCMSARTTKNPVLRLALGA